MSAGALSGSNLFCTLAHHVTSLALQTMQTADGSVPYARLLLWLRVGCAYRVFADACLRDASPAAATLCSACFVLC
jgi:hypothetical protein